MNGAECRANLERFDCLTLVETAIACARLLGSRPPYKPAALLKEIETLRYRDGKCRGFASKLFSMEEAFHDNTRRGTYVDITKKLGGIRRPPAPVNHVSRNWKGFPYIQANPGVIAEIQREEDRISKLPIHGIALAQVPAIEAQLRAGDIIAILTDDPEAGTCCRHVGLAAPHKNGEIALLHVGNGSKHVRLDPILTRLLKSIPNISGIAVARIQEVS